VAVLVVHRMPDICGTSSEIGGMNTRPLVIVEDSAVCLDQWTLDHEIGHLLGARHNPETGKREPKKYGYGKLLQPAGEGVVGFSTIMVSAKSTLQFKFEMVLKEYTGAGGKLTHEKNQKQKISRHCPFKCNISYYQINMHHVVEFRRQKHTEGWTAA
jgi:hypothetical protein